MNILIPMAGKGSRFIEAGYTLSKPMIPTTDISSGEKIPMVVAATKSIPNIGNPLNTIYYVNRPEHKDIEQQIQAYFDNVKFITVEKLTDGQASSCLLAKEFINNDEELLIAACDNGMIYNLAQFNNAKQKADALIFTYRNHQLVLEKPQAHGWVVVSNDNQAVSQMSVKKPISNTPLADHAVVGCFWFKHGHDFVNAVERMIQKNDRINNEFYVDQVMQHMIELDMSVKIFEVERYLCWGTPKDYELYENTINYWKSFLKHEEKDYV